MTFARAVALLLFVTAGLAQAQPYKRTQMRGQQVCIYWQVRQYIYQLDSAGYSKMPLSAVKSAVDSSFLSWQDLSDGCSGFQFIQGTPLSRPSVGYLEGGVNHNVITFRENSCTSIPQTDLCWNNKSCANVYHCWNHPDAVIALTTATYDINTGVILDADIELNASTPPGGAPPYTFTSVSSPVCPDGLPAQNCISTDVQDTLTHEIGHVLGLAHVVDASSTMFAVAQPGELTKRIIDPGTASGFCAIYPSDNSSSAACDLTAQTNAAITGSGSGTSLSAAGCSTVQGGPGGAALLLGLCVTLLATARRRLVGLPFTSKARESSSRRAI